MRIPFLSVGPLPHTIVHSALMLALVYIFFFVASVGPLGTAMVACFGLVRVEPKALTFAASFSAAAIAAWALASLGLASAVGIGRGKSIAWYGAAAFLFAPAFGVALRAGDVSDGFRGFAIVQAAYGVPLLFSSARAHCAVSATPEVKLLGITACLAASLSLAANLLLEFWLSVPERVGVFAHVA
jgi:hypothetical protein